MGPFAKGRCEIEGHFSTNEVENDEEGTNGYDGPIGGPNTEFAFDFGMVVEILKALG